MPSVNRSALVRHPAGRMFELVNDVDSYADFLPWCGGSKRVRQPDGSDLASVTIDFKGIRNTFTTHNRHEEQRITHMKLVNGPFSKLQGRWEFVPLDEHSSKVVLALEFDFKNFLVRKALGSIFGGIADSMVDAFCKRADELFPPGEGGSEPRR